jgi:hypothetical protein
LRILTSDIYIQSDEKIIFIVVATLIYACNSNNQHKHTDKDSTIDYLLQENAVDQLSIINHKKIVNIKGDFKSFKSYLNDLSNDSLSSIPYALDYIKTCISKVDPNRDSVFLLFNIKFYTVINKLSDSLDTTYKFIIDQNDKHSKTVESSAFKNNLSYCGIDIFSSEGIYYLDVIYDFFYEL